MKKDVITSQNYSFNRKNVAVSKSKCYFFMKRCFDLVGSLLLLLFLSPLLLLIALLIKIDDPKGKVIFSQTRIGKDGEPFRMYKFRSMYADAEKRLEDLLALNEVEGAMFKMKEDPRVTNIGKFIRKTSIDELPQLVNVLKGDMSLVGPRPPLVREVLEYTDYDKQRLLVKPGCTGLWQVMGRNNVSFQRMVELDLTYIEKQSMGFDFYILYRTVWVLLSQDGAY